MRILLSCLRDFVDIEESPRDLAHSLTMAGMAVDEIEEEAGETVFEIDITSNRPDAMNHFGIAREVASIYGRPLRRPLARVQECAIAAASRAAVEIENADLCHRYVGRVFSDVRVRPSPDWMRKRLELCDVRSINNLADLTNYVLLEIGQPTHAFDLDKLAERRIVVRRALDGETLVTLDGESRDLTPGQLVICDAQKPVALAGVMGGLATEITEETRNVLLEAAWFQPAVVRNASRRFKLFTEASHRFERGADWDAAPWAADRIASLLAETGAGSVLAGRIDCSPRPRSRPSIGLRRNRIARILGVSVDDEAVESILRSLGFRPTRDAEGWCVPAVSHRLDVEREIDLIEEFARVHGFARVPATLPSVGREPAEAPLLAEDTHMRAGVRALGYDETIGFSFISSAEERRFGTAPCVKLRNPLSRRWMVMRNSAVPTMLRAIEWNLRRNQSAVRLAEFGRIYETTDGRHREPRVLTLGASGPSRLRSWDERPRPMGFYDLKADVSSLLRAFDTGVLRFDTEGVPSHFRPGHAAAVRSRGRTVGHFGEINPRLARERKIRKAVFVAEIYLDPLYEAGLRRHRLRRLPRVPAVSRDFSLLVPEGVTFESVIDAVGDMQDLQSLRPLEIFRGKNVPQGHYSLLLRASWQRLDESLTDAEVNEFADTLRSSLKSKLGVEART